MDCSPQAGMAMCRASYGGLCILESCRFGVYRDFARVKDHAKQVKSILKYRSMSVKMNQSLGRIKLREGSCVDFHWDFRAKISPKCVLK